MLQAEVPGVKISNVEVPQNEDVNSLMDSHSEEILLHLINSRKEMNFLFSSDEAVRNEKVKEAETYVNTATPADEKNLEQAKTKGLETSNPYNLRYESEAAQYQIKGFRIDQMDSLKITLQISQV
jgi:hypothetical protein